MNKHIVITTVILLILSVNIILFAKPLPPQNIEPNQNVSEEQMTNESEDKTIEQSSTLSQEELEKIMNNTASIEVNIPLSELEDVQTNNIYDVLKTPSNTQEKSSNKSSSVETEKNTKSQNTNVQTEKNLQPVDYTGEVSQYLLDKVNTLRASVGVAPLSWDASLASTASVRSIEMYNGNKFSHTRPNGTSWATAFPNYNSTAENIAMTYGLNMSATELADRMFNELCNSSSHYATMISPDYNLFGTAMYGETDRTYMQQSFGNTAPNIVIPSQVADTSEDVNTPAQEITETQPDTSVSAVNPVDVSIEYVEYEGNNIMNVIVNNSSSYSESTLSNFRMGYSAPDGYILMFEYR